MANNALSGSDYRTTKRLVTLLYAQLNAALIQNFFKFDPDRNV